MSWVTLAIAGDDHNYIKKQTNKQSRFWGLRYLEGWHWWNFPSSDPVHYSLVSGGSLQLK